MTAAADEVMASGGEQLMKAVVIGSTGATGRCVVGSLLRAKDKVGKVILLARRRLESLDPEYGIDIRNEESSGRLEQHIENLEKISDDTVKQLCTGADVFFNCLGTTMSKSANDDEFRRFDYELPIRIIKIARTAGVRHCSMVTSAKASTNSIFLYFRTKGQLESDVRDLDFEHTSVYRVKLLDRGEMGTFVEKTLKLVLHSLPVPRLAECMLLDAWDYSTTKTLKTASDKVAIFEVSDILKLTQNWRK